MQAPVLTTENLRMEPISLAHWEGHATSWADPAMTVYIGGKPHTRQESWKKFIGAAGLWSLFGYGQWAIVDRDSGTYLGIGGLMHLERGIPELEGYPEAGWSIIPSAWGRGLATEAMKAMLAWADAHLDAPEIRCIIDPGNVVSARVAQKLGFEYLADSKDVIGDIHIFRRPSQGR